jgi:hypothetical protein
VQEVLGYFQERLAYSEEPMENFTREKEMKNKEFELLPMLQKLDNFASDVKLLIEKLKQMNKDIKELKKEILEI